MSCYNRDVKNMSDSYGGGKKIGLVLNSRLPHIRPNMLGNLISAFNKFYLNHCTE